LAASRAAHCGWVAHVQGTLCLEKIGFVFVRSVSAMKLVGRKVIEGIIFRNEANFAWAKIHAVMPTAAASREARSAMLVPQS
jgi:hypothetical protein